MKPKSQGKVLITLVIVSLSIMNVNGQSPKGYVVNGQIKNIKNKTWIYLIHNTDEGGADTINRTQANEGRFRFQGLVPLEGEAYFIKFDTTQSKYEKPIKGYIVLLMENNKIQIKGNIANLGAEHVSITGSATHNDYISYLRNIKPIVAEINMLNNKANLTRDTFVSRQVDFRIDSLNKAITLIKKNWVSKHSASYLTPWFIKQLFQSEKDTLWLFQSFESLTISSKRSKYGTQLKLKIESIKNTSIGTRATNFEFLNQYGKSISLNEVISQGKLTLVDFWASWCKPCRITFSNLKDLYKKYHLSGFNIIGISIDKNMSAWKNAILTDSLPWFNVREENRIASILYGIEAIPTSFLLDANGKIIARWSGENKQLENIITQLLQ